jgi:hypothetical protein
VLPLHFQFQIEVIGIFNEILETIVFIYDFADKNIEFYKIIEEDFFVGENYKTLKKQSLSLKSFFILPLIKEEDFNFYTKEETKFQKFLLHCD